MIAEFGHLSAKDKVLKAIELSSRGLSKSEISLALYDTKDDKSRLGALRKHMKRHGYVWDDELNRYVLAEDVSPVVNKEPQTKTNKEPQTQINKPVLKQRKSIIKQRDDLTQEDIIALKSIIEEFQSLKALLEAPKEVSGGIESPLAYSTFTGTLQATTLQLHSEVWDGLNDFCKNHKVSKKAVVNEAIWDFLEKYEGTELQSIPLEKENI